MVFTFFLCCIVSSNGQGHKITSVLQVIDLATGTAGTVREFPYRIEAPFWSKDGKFIVYNSDGKLFRVDAGGKGDLVHIVSKGADHLNNDHVLSPDGTRIGISSQSRPDGKSRIYIIPFSGGDARLVTPNGPSYLHGWSPDGSTLVYCAERNGNFDIYTISADGGTEKRLTVAKGLDDGPEYSPDGKYIWFNSVRTGVMQIWKMNADGSSQQQMTFDKDVYSWFPHISPDGTRVVYIVYHKGEVGASEHLADKNVALRVIPAEGGTPQTLIELRGGQGSINVNPWSPDGKKIAFVSYRID